MPDREKTLQINELSCTRGDRDLFAGLGFTLKPGELLQVEGHNGCGKTSLLRIVSGLMPEESGDVLWGGVEKSETDFYADTMYLGHQTGIKHELTALENLDFSRQMQKPNNRCRYEVLEKLGLRGFEDVPCLQLSAGQKRRVGLARLLLSDCQLWILDEPFTALDVDGVALVEKICAEHCAQGGMILLTTHQPLQSLAAYKKSINIADFAVEHSI